MLDWKRVPCYVRVYPSPSPWSNPRDRFSNSRLISLAKPSQWDLSSRYRINLWPDSLQVHLQWNNSFELRPINWKTDAKTFSAEPTVLNPIKLGEILLEKVPSARLECPSWDHYQPVSPWACQSRQKTNFGPVWNRIFCYVRRLAINLIHTRLWIGVHYPVLSNSDDFWVFWYSNRWASLFRWSIKDIFYPTDRPAQTELNESLV